VGGAGRGIPTVAAAFCVIDAFDRRDPSFGGKAVGKDPATGPASPKRWRRPTWARRRVASQGRLKAASTLLKAGLKTRLYDERDRAFGGKAVGKDRRQDPRAPNVEDDPSERDAVSRHKAAWRRPLRTEGGSTYWRRVWRPASTTSVIVPLAARPWGRTRRQDPRAPTLKDEPKW